MNRTKEAIHASLWGQPIAKAALFAYLELMKRAGRCGSTAFQLRDSYVARAEAIAVRFRIRDLVLIWRNAA